VLDDGLPAVSIDAASITEVIYILLDNASKYAPAGTAITVRAAREDHRHVRITVSDEGPGIPKEMRERIFQPFFSTKKKQNATGLGLTVATGFIQQMGGVLRFESEPGKTTFQMLLPSRAEA